MKKILFLLILLTFCCFGCGYDSETNVAENPFKKYAESPVFFEGYQKYFVNEYCDEAYNFNDKYEEINNKVSNMIKSKEYSPVVVKSDHGLFSNALTWEVGSSVNSKPETQFRYIGPLKDNKPDGIGIIVFGKYSAKVYAGEFEDGKFNGYGIQYSYPGYSWKVTDFQTFLNNTNIISIDDANNKLKNYTDKIYDNYDDLMYDKSWMSKFYNYINYEGYFKDGLREGKGVIYNYKDGMRWVDSGKPKDVLERQRKILGGIKYCNDELSWMRTAPGRGNEVVELENKLNNLEKELKNLNDPYKNIITKLNVSGRLYVMSGEFSDNKQKGEFVCYTQESTAAPGYKLFKCDVDKDYLSGEGQLWNDKGEILFEGSGNEITYKYRTFNAGAPIVIKTFDFNEIKKQLTAL